MIAAGLFLIIAALGGAAYGYYWHSPAPRLPPLSAAIQRATVCVGGRQRTYLAFVPAKLPSGSTLVIVLHGSGMDGTRMREWTGYEFDRIADQQGFAVVYPDGYRRNWNDCRKNATFAAKKENIDDVSFIGALIDRLRPDMPSAPSGSAHSDTRMAVTWPSVWRWKHLTRSQQSRL